MTNPVLGRLAFLFVVVSVCGCAQSLRDVDSLKRASMDHEQIRPLGGLETSVFVTTRAAVLLTGTDEATNVRVAKNDVQGFFRLNGEPRGLIGGCVAVPIDARGYWLSASHCLASGAALIHRIVPEGQEGVVPARVVWTGDLTRAGPRVAVCPAR